MNTRVPSFSIIVETENLATADLNGLTRSLDALSRQTVPVEHAAEVFIVDGGDVPAEIMAALQARFPWLKPFRVSEGLHYYAAKMRAVHACSGDVCVFYDSDCIYEPEWLANLLQPFSDDPRTTVVGGETRVPAEGIYGLANALTYLFPPYTGAQSPRKAGYYFFNNVAFRRELLLKHPLPSTVPVYRGHCYLHAQGLIGQGHEIRIEPAARASHAPPNGLSHFFWRYLLMGSDELTVRRILDATRAGDRQPLTMRPLRDSVHVLGGAYMKAKQPLARLWPVVRESPPRLLLLPLALPVVGAALLLYATGLGIAYWRPHFSLEASRHWEGTSLSEGARG